VPWTVVPWEVGLIACPKMVAWNYLSTLYKIPKECRSQPKGYINIGKFLT